MAPDFRETYIGDIVRLLESEEFKNENATGDSGKGFTRKRKLSFTYLIILITQGLTRSIQRELNSFYQKIKGGDFSIQEITKSAFTHARKKLKWQAFAELNKKGIESFYKNAPYLKWKGFRVLAIDGSTMMLPNHPTVQEEFGKTYFGPNESVSKSAARISMLYDVLNFTTIDAQIGRYDTSERELAAKHLPLLKAGEDLVIMDRGYPSFELFHKLQQSNIDYCIRWREEWWKEVSEMLETGECDRIITLKKNDGFCDFPPKLLYKEITVRIVIVVLSNGNKEVLMTSLLDNEKYPYESFLDLYGSRWAIEEGFKFYKSRLQLEAFSGKTALAIKQDFYAKVFMMTTMAVMAFPIEEKLKAEQKETNRKHTYKVNRTNALSMVKEVTSKIFMGKWIKESLKAFDDFLKKTVEIVRPNRKVERKKGQKKPPSMNYKQL
jgi:hypothetical protein